VFSDLSQDGQHGHVRLAGTGRRTKQNVFVRVQTDFGQLALDPVQRLEALKSTLGIGGQGFDGHQLKFKNKILDALSVLNFDGVQLNLKETNTIMTKSNINKCKFFSSQ